MRGCCFLLCKLREFSTGREWKVCALLYGNYKQIGVIVEYVQFVELFVLFISMDLNFGEILVENVVEQWV